MNAETIRIRNSATGETFDYTPSEELWLDLIAASRAMGITVEQLIVEALTRFFDQPDVRLQIPERE